MAHIARVVVYLDLDVEVLPSWTRWAWTVPPVSPSAARHRPSAAGGDTGSKGVDVSGWVAEEEEAIARASARDWHHLISCMASSQYNLLSYPDHSSPVHGGLLVVRP